MRRQKTEGEKRSVFFSSFSLHPFADAPPIRRGLAECRKPRMIGSNSMTTLAYKRNCEAILARLRLRRQRQAGDQIFAAMDVPSRTLDDFRTRQPNCECECPDPAQRADFRDSLLAERSRVRGRFPAGAYLSESDEDLYTGLLGADVRFMAHPDSGWISSMAPPLLKGWSDSSSIHFRAIGRRRENTLPCPASLSTVARPP